METFSTQVPLETTISWAKPICTHPQSWGCSSTCTTLSQTSQASPSFFDMEQEDGIETHFLQAYLASPRYIGDFDDSSPEDSVYAHDGSFDERLQDSFFDIPGEDEAVLQQFEEEQQQQGCMGGVIVSSKSWKKKGGSENKRRKLVAESWEMIRKMFLKYLGTQKAAMLVKQEMNQQVGWENNIKSVYKTLKRLAKKISRGHIISYLHEVQSKGGGQDIFERLFKNLFFDFLNGYAEFAIGGLSNINRSMEEMMVKLLARVSQAFNLRRCRI